MLVWGLTGNIACGKSAVEALVRARGIPVLDADRLAREVVEPGQPALAEIQAAFGDGILLPDGGLDRPALGAIVFADAEARARLEAITHPRILGRTLERLAELAAEGHAISLVSAALMIESGSYRNYAGLAVVTCDEELQLQRLRARDDLGEDEARQRIASQRPQAEKAALADVVLDNGGTLDQLEQEVGAWLDGMTAA